MADELQLSGWDTTRALCEANPIDRELRLNTGADDDSKVELVLPLSTNTTTKYHWPSEERLATAISGFTTSESITSGAEMIGCADDSWTNLTGNTDLQSVLTEIDSLLGSVASGVLLQDGSANLQGNMIIEDDIELQFGDGADMKAYFDSANSMFVLEPLANGIPILIQEDSVNGYADLYFGLAGVSPDAYLSYGSDGPSFTLGINNDGNLILATGGTGLISFRPNAVQKFFIDSDGATVPDNLKMWFGSSGDSSIRYDTTEEALVIFQDAGGLGYGNILLETLSGSINFKPGGLSNIMTLDSESIIMEYGFMVKELTASNSAAGYGFFWVKDNTPNRPRFTDDATTDFWIPISDGTTGGSGSAGAGNQYVELEINGNTYKVLHDGTV